MIVNVILDTREKIVMKILMTAQMDLAKMEELVKMKLMTMFVIVVVGIVEKIVKFSILVTSKIEAVVTKFVRKMEPEPFADARRIMSSTRIREPA